MKEEADATTPRVVMLLESYLPVVGGMEAQASTLAGALHRAGTPVFILTRRTQPSLPREEVMNGIRVVRLGPTGRSSRLRWPMVLTALWALFRHRKSYDLILVPGFRTLGLSAVWAGAWLRKRVVLKAESSGELSGAFFAGGLERSGIGANSFLARCIIRLRNRSLVKADAFVGLSSEQVREFQSAGVDGERIHVIPQCLDASVFSPASDVEKSALRRKLNLPDHEVVTVYTGRLVRYKGLPVLLEAWKELCANQPTGLLLLVGGGGVDIYNCEDELRAYAEAHGLEKRVRFTGDVTNVPDYLRAADIYAFPTENEAFGLALIEAMSCGLGIMSTPTGGIKDYLEDGKNGLVMRAGHVSDAVRQWGRLLEDSSLRQCLGQAARQTVLERFTLDAVAQAYLDLFGRLG